MNAEPEQNHSFGDFSDPSEHDAEGTYRLPEPDLENVTVLTDGLPNNPILPWNHYDSPWQKPEEEEDLEEPTSAIAQETEDPPAAIREEIEEGQEEE